jgi:NADPH:quinone reductase-like Zn-dependent oxidoreductase
MRVFEIREFGLDKLAVGERPDPEPGPGQVAVKVRAAALNFRDVLMVRGHYNPRLPLPVVPLSDGMGEVIAVGDGVDKWKTGDRVAACFTQGFVSRPVPRDGSYLKNTLGGPLDGMLAEIVVLPADSIVAAPAHLSDEEVATLPCAAVTAWSALFSEGSVRSGDTVVVQGTGGVSIFALQLAKLAGARTIVTSSSDAKLEKAKALGADELINYKTTPDWGKQIKKLTGGIGADHIVEVGGSGTLSQSLRGIRAGGEISVIGVLSGGKGELNITPVLMRNIRLQGIFVGSREDFEALNRAVTQHELKPVIDRTFPFEESREALEYLASGQHFGKVCIRFE